MTKARSKPSYVFRAIYPKEYIDGYIAKISRQSGRLFEVFQLKDYDGSHSACKRAAVLAATSFDRDHPKISRRARAEITRPKEDRSLPPGVRVFERTLNDKQYKLAQATWSPKPGVTKTKAFYFSRRRSRATAIALANAARAAGVAEMIP